MSHSQSVAQRSPCEWRQGSSSGASNRPRLPSFSAHWPVRSSEPDLDAVADAARTSRSLGRADYIAAAGTGWPVTGGYDSGEKRSLEGVRLPVRRVLNEATPAGRPASPSPVDSSG